MPRRARYIGGNKGTEGPSNLIFVDTESHIGKTDASEPHTTHTLRLWCATRVRLEGGEPTRRVIASGTTAGEFWRFVDSHSDATRRTWIFAHNVGFDATLLGYWKELDSGALTIAPMFRRDRKGKDTQERSWSGKLVIDNRVTFLVFRSGSKTYTWVDTLNYWPTKLWEIGEKNGTPKLDMPPAAAPDRDWLTYCRRDVEIIEVAVTALIRRWVSEGCGVFKTTAASLAFTNWLHTCDVRTPDGRKVDVVCEPDSPQHVMERASYFGGRVQPFHVGKLGGPLYHLDVNSLYPYVMQNNSFPRRYIRHESGVTPDSLLDASRCYGIVASVLIQSRIDTYPVRIDGRQYHLTGSFWCTLCGAELARALRDRHVVRVGTAQYYSVAPLFQAWVRYWYGRKARCGTGAKRDHAEYEFCKTILNSLGGKFAQHGRLWTECPGEIALTRWGSWGGPPPARVPGKRRDSGDARRDDATVEATGKTRFSYRGIAGHVQCLMDDQEPRHAFPAISAFITAYGREHMYRIINSLPARSVFYMATDSLLVSRSGYQQLLRGGHVHPTRLGAFRLVAEYHSGEIMGSNHYEVDGEITAAGLEGKAYIDMAGRKVCDLWERLPSVVSSGPRDTIQVSSVQIGEPAYDRKGWLDREGWWQPWRLSPDPDFTDKPRHKPYSMDDVARLATDSWK